MRFVVDVDAALHLASGGAEVAAQHELLAPTLLRSQALSVLHETVHRGELPADVAQARLKALQGLKIRLLGDALATRDESFVERIDGLVATVPIEALARADVAP